MLVPGVESRRLHEGGGTPHGLWGHHTSHARTSSDHQGHVS